MIKAFKILVKETIRPKHNKEDWYRLGRLLRVGYIRYRHWSGFGNSVTADFKGLVETFTAGGVFILWIQARYGILLPYWILPLAWLFQKIGELIITKICYRWRVWQEDTKYIQDNINPIEKEKMRILRKLEKNGIQ